MRTPILVLTLILLVSAVRANAVSMTACEDFFPPRTETPLALVDIAGNLRLVSQTVEDGNFFDGRGMFHYLKKLVGFGTFLNYFRRGSVWIDIGTGRAQALLDYQKTTPGRLSQLVGIGYKIPIENIEGIAEGTAQGNFQYIEGDIATLNLNGVTKANAVTDLLGAVTYSDTDTVESEKTGQRISNLPNVLRQSLSLLKPHGHYFISFVIGKLRFETDETRGHTKDFFYYLEQVRGIKIVRKDISKPFASVEIRLTGEPIVLPALPDSVGVSRSPTNLSF